MILCDTGYVYPAFGLTFTGSAALAEVCALVSAIPVFVMPIS